MALAVLKAADGEVEKTTAPLQQSFLGAMDPRSTRVVSAGRFLEALCEPDQSAIAARLAIAAAGGVQRVVVPASKQRPQTCDRFILATEQAVRMHVEPGQALVIRLPGSAALTSGPFYPAPLISAAPEAHLRRRGIELLDGDGVLSATKPAASAEATNAGRAMAVAPSKVCKELGRRQRPGLRAFSGCGPCCPWQMREPAAARRCA